VTIHPSTPPSEQARAHHMANLPAGERPPTGAWAGWVTFAALMLVFLGTLNGLQGFIALLDDGYFVAPSNDLVLVNYDVYGGVLVFWGALLMLVGAGLNARRGWARWTAVVLVMVDALLQVGFFPSMPLLAVLLIAIDVVVVFALTVRWDEAQGGTL
jgi:hypothetical protein